MSKVPDAIEDTHLGPSTSTANERPKHSINQPKLWTDYVTK